MLFDFVVGNPPFQGAKGQIKTLYPSITVKAIKHLKKNGQMIFIHPSGWRQGNQAGKELQKIYKEHTIKAELFDYHKGVELWNIKSDIDIIKLTKNYTPNLQVKFLDKEVFETITEWDLLPTSRYEEFLLVYEANKHLRIDITPPAITYTVTSPTKNKEFKYPVIKRLPNNFPEKGCCYAKETPPTRPRICIGWGSKINLLDLDGEYHMDPYNNKVIYDENDSKENLIRMFEVISSTKFLQFLSDLSGVDQLRFEDYRFRNRLFFWNFKRDFYNYLKF